MTTEPWTTKLQHILEKGFSDDDIFIVRLLAIDKTAETSSISMHTYSARLIHRENEIEWQINDNCGDFLIITADIEADTLGRLDIKDEENDRSYIVVSCFKYQYEAARRRYLINEKSSHQQIVDAQTKREASLIVNILHDAELEAEYVKNIHK